MAGIGVIINPFSKLNKKIKNPVNYYKEIAGDNADIRLTKSIEEIQKVMSDFKKMGISYLAISGGDGSIHHVISALINVYGNELLPNILLLRDGSMNNIAKSYSLKGTSSELLKKLINSSQNGERPQIIQRDTIKVGNRYCFMFGLGLIADYINEFNRGGRKGPIKALKVAFKFIHKIVSFNKKSANYINLSVFVNGTKLNFEEFIAVYAATIHNIALGFNPTSKAYKKDGTFHLIASGMKPKDLIKTITKFKTGKTVVHPNHFDDIASEIRIVHPGQFLYQMDGDLYQASDELLIHTGPQIGFVKFE